MNKFQLKDRVEYVRIDGTKSKKYNNGIIVRIYSHRNIWYKTKKYLVEWHEKTPLNGDIVINIFWCKGKSLMRKKSLYPTQMEMFK